MRWPWTSQIEFLQNDVKNLEKRVFPVIESEAIPEGTVLIGAFGAGAQVFEEYPHLDEVWRNRTTRLAVVVTGIHLGSRDEVSVKPFPGDGVTGFLISAATFMDTYERLAWHGTKIVNVDLDERVSMTVENPSQPCRRPEGEHCPYHDTMEGRFNG